MEIVRTPSAQARRRRSWRDDDVEMRRPAFATWVMLWVPVNLLIYDRWYDRRDLDALARIEAMEVRIVGGPAPPTGSPALLEGEASPTPRPA